MYSTLFAQRLSWDVLKHAKEFFSTPWKNLLHTDLHHGGSNVSYQHFKHCNLSIIHCAVHLDKLYYTSGLSLAVKEISIQWWITLVHFGLCEVLLVYRSSSVALIYPRGPDIHASTCFSESDDLSGVFRHYSISKVHGRDHSRRRRYQLLWALLEHLILDYNGHLMNMKM